MAPHSSTLAWKIPWTEEPGRLQSIGLRRLGHNWAASLSLSTFHSHALEKEMATHSSVLAWRIPGTGKPGGLPSMGSHRVGHDWSDLAAAVAAAAADGFNVTVPRDRHQLPKGKDERRLKCPELAIQWGQFTWPYLILRWWRASTTLRSKGEERRTLLSKLSIYRRSTYVKKRCPVIYSEIILFFWNGPCYARNN